MLIKCPNNLNNNTNSVYSFVNSITVVNSNLASDIQNLTAKSGDKQLTLNWDNLGSGSTFYVVRITDNGSSELVGTVTTTTATITGLENGKLYTYNVYASKDDMLQIKAKPIGPPIINSVDIVSGRIFNTDINLNGDTNLYIAIIAINSESNIEIIGPALYTTVNNNIEGNSSSYLAYTIIAVNSVGAIKYSSQI